MSSWHFRFLQPPSFHALKKFGHLETSEENKQANNKKKNPPQNLVKMLYFPIELENKSFCFQKKLREFNLPKNFNILRNI